MMRAENLRKVYQMDGAKVEALAGVTFHIAPGSYTALMGKSGSGKSTLMNMLGLLDTPTSGRYWLNGRDVSSLSEDELSVIRNREIGFVFQSHNLLARNTAVENVCLPLYYRGITRPQQQAAAALERVGLGHRKDHFPSQLSGGESQRVAIARAIVTEPRVILADEPTGNLDSRISGEILDIFGELVKTGVTLVMVTHEADVAARARRTLHIRDGRIAEDAA